MALELIFFNKKLLPAVSLKKPPLAWNAFAIFLYNIDIIELKIYNYFYSNKNCILLTPFQNLII